MNRKSKGKRWKIGKTDHLATGHWIQLHLRRPCVQKIQITSHALHSSWGFIIMNRTPAWHLAVDCCQLSHAHLPAIGKPFPRDTVLLTHLSLLRAIKTTYRAPSWRACRWAHHRGCSGKLHIKRSHKCKAYHSQVMLTCYSFTASASCTLNSHCQDHTIAKLPAHWFHARQKGCYKTCSKQTAA